MGGFQKSYLIFGGGMSEYLLFLTGVGRWSRKDQKHHYVIGKCSPNMMFDDSRQVESSKLDKGQIKSEWIDEVIHFPN